MNDKPLFFRERGDQYHPLHLSSLLPTDSSMTKFLTSPRTSQGFHLHITSSQSALSAPTLATRSMDPTATSLLLGSTQAKRSVQLHSARKDDSGKMAERCVCVCSLIPRPSPAPVFDCLQYAKVDQKVLQAIKSWRQEWPGNEASVCGGKTLCILR